MFKKIICCCNAIDIVIKLTLKLLYIYFLQLSFIIKYYTSHRLYRCAQRYFSTVVFLYKLVQMYTQTKILSLLLKTNLELISEVRKRIKIIIIMNTRSLKIMFLLIFHYNIKCGLMMMIQVYTYIYIYDVCFSSVTTINV